MKNTYYRYLFGLLLFSSALSPAFGQAGGEDCASATVIPALPFVGTGNNASATDDYAEVCPDVTNLGGGRDHVYKYTNGASTVYVNVSVCVAITDYDSQLYIYEDLCSSGTAVACQEDGCKSPAFTSAFNSEITGFMLQPGKTYYFVVDGYDATGGNYQINVDTASAPPGPEIPFSDATDSLTTSTFYSGVAVGVVDMNGDKRDDIVRLNDAKDLYINYQGTTGSFTEYNYGTVSSSLAWALVVADVDENGYNDFICGGSFDGLHFLKANSSGTAYTASSLGGPGIFLQGANFADINNDGSVDFFACNDVGTSSSYRNAAGTLNFDLTLINTATTPTSDNSGNYASLWTDYDADGDIDMYLSKCRQGVSDSTDPRRINQLFDNDGLSNYTEVGAAAGLRIGAQSWVTDFADIDNDGDLDAYVINHDIPSRLYRNNGDKTFTDITAGAGLDTIFTILGIQCLFRDFDNDGWIDLLVTGDEHHLFINNGDMTFRRDMNGFNYATYSMESAAIGDLNSDGFLDIYASYATPYNNPSSTKTDKLWLNEGKSGYNFLSIFPVGTVSNLNGIGAWMELHGPWGVQIREVRAGEGYGVMNSFRQHFGMKEETRADSLIIRWPSGIVDYYYHVDANEFVTCVEGSSPATPVIVWADSTTDIDHESAKTWGRLTVTDDAHTSVSVKYWKAGAAADSMWIGTYNSGGAHTTYNLNQLLTVLDPSSEYHWFLKATYDTAATHGGPELYYSDTLSFRTDSLTTGQLNPNEPSKITLYPNPSHDGAVLEFHNYDFNLNLAPEVRILDITGKVVRYYSKNLSKQVHIDRKGLKNGIYLYEVRDKSGIIGHGKMILQ